MSPAPTPVPLDEIEAAAKKANGDGVRWSLAEPERERGHEVLIDYDHPEPADEDGASLLHDSWLLQADAVHIAAADPPTVSALCAALRIAVEGLERTPPVRGFADRKATALARVRELVDMGGDDG